MTTSPTKVQILGIMRQASPSCLGAELYSFVLAVRQPIGTDNDSEFQDLGNEDVAIESFWLLCLQAEICGRDLHSSDARE